MASQGPKTAGTVVSDNSVGVPSWGSLTETAASDNSYATANKASSGAATQYLKCTNFGFTIPGGATINGVVVEIERKASQNGVINYIKDNIVKLVKGGTISGNDKADTVSKWPTSDTDASYGGSADLWGLTLTDSDINASNFGVAFSASINVSGKTNVVAYVDYLRITVYYTAGASFIASQQRPIQQAIKRSNFY